MDKSPGRPRISLAILAAGIGSRYGGLKQIAPLGPTGEILLDYAVYDAIQAGIDKVVFLIRPDMEQAFRECIGHRFESKLDVQYAYQRLVDPTFPETARWSERRKPWGTAHAILSCAPAIQEPFLVINADDFYGPSAYQTSTAFLRQQNASSQSFAMVAYRLVNTLSKHGTVARGVCEKSSSGHLTSIIEELGIQRNESGIITSGPASAREFTGDEPVSMNFWAFTPALFPLLAGGFRDFLSAHADLSTREYMIPSVIQSLINAGIISVQLLDSTDPWFGVTYTQDVPAVKSELAQLTNNRTYPSPLFPRMH